MAKIPPYELHRERLAKGREGALWKIKRYNIHLPEDAEFSAEMRADLSKKIENFLQGPVWHKRIKEAAGFSAIKLTSEQEKALDIAAGEIMLHFAYGGYLNDKTHRGNQVTTSRDPSFTSPLNPAFRERTIKKLEKISRINYYYSKTTWEALSRIQSFGFNDRSTLSICGHIITNIIEIGTKAKSGYISISPDNKSPLPDNPKEAEEQVQKRIDAIYDFGERNVQLLVNSHRARTTGDTSHYF